MFQSKVEMLLNDEEVKYGDSRTIMRYFWEIGLKQMVLKKGEMDEVEGKEAKA